MFSEAVENGMIVNAAAYDPEQREVKLYVCPRCGEDMGGDDVLYTNYGGDVVGCERCLFKETPSEHYDAIGEDCYDQ